MSDMVGGSDTMTDSVDDSIDIDPRPIEQVAQRAALLITLVRRAFLEAPGDGADHTDSFERETDRFELYSWARREFLDIMTVDERSALASPAGELGADPTDWCLSASVPARALVWSLGGQQALSPVDTPAAESDALVDWAPGPWEDVSRVARSLTRRREVELAAERERWELWYWRATLTTEDIHPGDRFDDTVAAVARDAERASLARVVANDFAVHDRPFSSLPSDDQARVAELAEGYLIALNWVCGIGSSWEDIPLYPD
jgi:hypothetical protein